ncbi:MAG: hypothetical protein KC731_05815 [Myxococcales bacterium]|nr:hypothetical protein [Myxococcales bacterium]
MRLQRIAIADRALREPPETMRAWLDGLLRDARLGDSGARDGMLAWATALLPGRDVEASLALRSLDRDLSDDEGLAVVTVAFLRATCAASTARRLSPRAKPGHDEQAVSWLRHAWKTLEFHERPKAPPSPEDLLVRPWLRHLSESERTSLSFDEIEALWQAWDGEVDPPTDYRIVLRPAHGRPFHISLRDSARQHPSIRLRRAILTEPALTEGEVLWMAAARPTRAGLLLAIAEEDRWWSRVRVRDALAQNPYTPTWLVAALLPSSTRRIQRAVVGSHHDPGVVALARALLAPVTARSRGRV